MASNDITRDNVAAVPDPGSFDEQLAKAKSAIKAGFSDQALVAATEAAKLAPERWEARLLLAQLWLGQRRSDRALADARSTLELGKDALPPEARRDAHDVIARALLAEGDRAGAEATLRVIYKEEPRSAVRLLGLLADSSRKDEACAVAREGEAAHAALATRFHAAAECLARAGIENEETLRSIAELELDAGLLDEARPRFQKIFAAHPDDESAQDGLRAIRAGGRAAAEPAAARAVRRELLVRVPGIRRILFGAGTGFAIAGLGTALFAKFRAGYITENGRDPRQVMLSGIALMVAAIFLFIMEIRVRRAATTDASTTN